MGSGGVGLARSTSLLTGPIFTLRKICYANFYKCRQLRDKYVNYSLPYHFVPAEWTDTISYMYPG